MDAAPIILAQLDRLEARLGDMQRDGEDRGRRLWVEMNAQGKSIALIGHRVEQVEKSVAGHSLTLGEYQDLKRKAEGAGWLGRKLWWFGGILIGAVSYVAGATGKLSSMLAWLAGK